MCHVNSNDNTAPAPVPAPRPPPLPPPLNYLPGLLAESMLHWDRRPSLPSPAANNKTRLVREIAHLRFLLIFSFQQKNDRSWGEEGAR